MRRLFRILVNALSILSLLLCLATAALWVRGYWRMDAAGWRRAVAPGEPEWWFGLSSAGGRLMVFGALYPPPAAPQRLPGGWYWHSYDNTPIRYAGGPFANRWGFGLISTEAADVRERGIVLPAWAATVFFALLPAIRLASIIRRRRLMAEGHCLRCGYDLRATPERCPECGQFPAGATGADAA